MEVHIRLHGILRDKLPPEARGRIVLDLPEGARVGDILSRFDLRRPVALAVNEEVEIEPDHPLSQGDRIEIFNVIGGG